jgi:hypothetical protein
MSASVNNQRVALFKKIYEIPIEERDNIFMKDYSTIAPNEMLLDYETCLKNIFANDFVSQLTFKLKQHNIESFIGGSYCLSCVHAINKFKSNDIDLYITNITKEKLETIEQILYEIYYIDEIYVVTIPLRRISLRSAMLCIALMVPLIAMFTLPNEVRRVGH